MIKKFQYILTVFKAVAERLCFYTCLSVIRFTGGVCPVHAWIHTRTPGQTSSWKHTPRKHTAVEAHSPGSIPPEAHSLEAHPPWKHTHPTSWQPLQRTKTYKSTQALKLKLKSRSIQLWCSDLVNRMGIRCIHKWFPAQCWHNLSTNQNDGMFPIWFQENTF